MAKIVIYDTTLIDKTQIREGLAESKHEVIFKKNKLDVNSIEKDAEIISVFVTSNVTKELIEAMPKLKLIACRSTGFNNVDIKAASEQGIAVTTVPSYGEQTVAEYTIALLLMLSRKLADATDQTKQLFLPANQLMGFDLAGKTLGIIGTGRIGAHVAKIAKGFDMKLVGYDPFPNKELAKELGLKYLKLDELLKQSDIVSLHVPYMKATHHLLSAEKIIKMKKSALLINTARGELVETEALISALTKKQLAGAALDVLEGETLWHLDDKVNLLINNSSTHEDAQHSLEQLALMQLPNVIISPHNAYNTVEAVGRINSTTCKNITDFFKGRLENKVELPKQEVGKLIIVRHAESEWNAIGRWTGQTDIHLSDQGYKDAANLGELLARINLPIDRAYCSEQVRSRETLEIMLASAGQSNVETLESAAINERDYGDYTGIDKWQVKKEVGAKEFDEIRRGWDHKIPNGETLKMVFQRVVPFYEHTILPQLKDGKNILIVAHGNSLRALMKYIENLSIKQVTELEMLLGQIVTYEIKDDGLMATKRVDKLAINSPKA